jgi:hypothetical protein
MYDAFRRERLSAAGSGGIKVDLPVMNVPDPGRRTPMLAASLLLTNVPVCILGADRVDLGTRLAFLDSVTALLPYGLRAELSTSTWANSIYEEHKFRLFFTSARRHADEHVLRWDPDRVVSVRHGSEDYLHWLSTSTRAKMDLLARQIRPTGFRPDDVRQMMQDLRAAWAQAGRYEADDPYASSYTIDRSRSAGTRLAPAQPPAQLVPTKPLPVRRPDAAPAVVDRRDPAWWRPAPGGEGGRRPARRALRAGGATLTVVAARPEVKSRPKAELMVTREAPVAVRLKDLRISTRRQAVRWVLLRIVIPVIVVTALVLILAAVG